MPQRIQQAFSIALIALSCVPFVPTPVLVIGVLLLAQSSPGEIRRLSKRPLIGPRIRHEFLARHRPSRRRNVSLLSALVGLVSSLVPVNPAFQITYAVFSVALALGLYVLWPRLTSRERDRQRRLQSRRTMSLRRLPLAGSSSIEIT
jgi:hypothetical protein